MRLLALNIQHAAVRRVPLVAKAVLDAAPDVVVLSEFYVDAQGKRLLGLLEAGGLAHHEHGVPGSERYPYTVVIASRTPIALTRRPLDGSPHAQRILEATISGISVAAVYFPLAKEHDPFWDGLFSPYADSLATRPAIIAGDWNTGSGALDIGGGPVAGMSRSTAFSRRVGRTRGERSTPTSGSSPGTTPTPAMASASTTPCSPRCSYRAC